VALAFARRDGELASGAQCRAGERADLRDARFLLNPGSVGQPRDGDPRAAWLVLDVEEATATWQRTDYDIAGAQEAIRAADLPDSLAERLGYGQ
jgi:diadenosine tetraphosphatase ApaH/serine/threonine PP2A family protein phosphatase